MTTDSRLWSDTASVGLNTDWRARRRIAAHPATPARVLAQLAHDPVSFVRCAVAYNPHTPPSVLQHLIHDLSIGVRSFVAWNTSTPPDALATLLDYAINFHTRLGLARNPYTPVSVLEALVTTHKEVGRGSYEDEDQFRWAMYHHPHTTATIHAQLLPYTLGALIGLGIGDTVQRAVALAHPYTLPQTIVRYTQLHYWHIPREWLPRYAMALNPNTPLETLKLLSEDVNPTVRRQAQQHIASHGQKL